MAGRPVPEASKEFGARLRSHRVDAGYTGPEVIMRLGMTVEELNMIERGILVPDTQKLLQLCLMYHVNQVERTLLLKTSTMLRRGDTADSATRPAAAGIFISYRRSDAANVAALLYDKLSREFGPEHVVKNVDSVEFGLSFVPRIRRSVSRCTAQVVVISRNWITANNKGQRNIDNPNDHVRAEVETALTQNLLVIPALVSGVRMPLESELPAELRRLASLSGIELSPGGFDSDVGRIIDVIYGRQPSIQTRSDGMYASAAPLIFLCHSSGDKERVRDLYWRLKRDNIQCWFDEEDLMPGDEWDREITRAIKRSKYILACVSKASVAKSGYVQKELKKALDVADEQPEGVAYLIPVRLEECEIPDRLSRWHWVDLFKDGAYERLVRRLRA